MKEYTLKYTSTKFNGFGNIKITANTRLEAKIKLIKIDAFANNIKVVGKCNHNDNIKYMESLGWSNKEIQEVYE